MQKRCLMVTVMILMMLMGLYIATSEPAVYAAFAAMTNKPIYRFAHNEAVCLVTAYNEDGTLLKERLLTMTNKKVNITIYVSAEWAKSNADTMRTLSDAGHEFALLGTAGQTAQEQIETFAEALGQNASSFMLHSGAYTADLCVKLKEKGLPMVLWRLPSS